MYTKSIYTKIKMSYYVYIIEGIRTSKKNYGNIVYYTGMTGNPVKRLNEHRAGIKSNYMRNNKIVPRRYVYIEQLSTYKEALARETQIKNLSLDDKQGLIREYNQNH